MSKDKFKLNSIESAIKDIRDGKIVIVVDDKNRENEGDFLASAELVTPEIINFMATHGRGLICAPITENISKRLGLNLMVGTNTDPQDTAFTVSIDLKGNGVTTGISASDRAATIRALIDKKTKANQFSKPGHVFPLVAKSGGVLRRTGHTEAAIDLPRLAGLKPAGVIVEIMNEDGSMARVPDLIKVAKSEAENSKVAIRNQRRDANTLLKEFLNEKEISQDDLRRGEDLIQKITDDFINKIDSLLEKKEKDLLEI